MDPRPRPAQDSPAAYTCPSCRRSDIAVLTEVAADRLLTAGDPELLCDTCLAALDGEAEADVALAIVRTGRVLRATAAAAYA